MGEKWNQDVSPSERLLWLYTLLLYSGKGFTQSELSDILNCSKPTVSRMLDKLEAARFGRLIEDGYRNGVVYKLYSPEKLPLLSLNAEGFCQLALCRDFMIHLLPESIRKSIDAALAHASAFLPGREGEDPFPIEGQSYVKGRIDYTPFQKTLQTLTQAIRDCRAYFVTYQASLKEEPKTFWYAPKRLLAYHETLRFSGWTVAPDGKPRFNEPTVLLLHRIKEVSLARTNALNLPDTEDKPRDAFGVKAEEPFTVAVRFDPLSATYAAERVWSVDQEVEHHDDGSVTLTVTARSRAEVISWILSFRDTAEVLSPDWLRGEIAGKARAMAARYDH